MKVILMIFTSIGLVLAPLLVIIAINTLFNLGIAYNIDTYCASLILCLVIQVRIYSTN